MDYVPDVFEHCIDLTVEQDGEGQVVWADPTVRRSMCLASRVMTARGSGVTGIDQSERRLAQACALIGRELGVTRGDRCGRVLAVRQTLDSVHWLVNCFNCFTILSRSPVQSRGDVMCAAQNHFI